MQLNAEYMKKQNGINDTVRKIETQIKETEEKLQSITESAQRITKTLIESIIALQTGTTFHKNKDGKIHRDDGPAVITKDFEFYWAVNGEFYSFEDWCIELNKSDEEITKLKLKY